jgi:hypothetical protein
MSLSDAYIKLYEEKCNENYTVLGALLKLSCHQDVLESKEVRTKVDEIIHFILHSSKR